MERRLKKRAKWVAPARGADSDLDCDDDVDDEILDPDFLPDSDDEDLPSSGRVSGSVSIVQPQDISEDEDEWDEDSPPKKKARMASEHSWKKEDIKHPPLGKYTHTPPADVLSPYEYFEDMFPIDLVDHIVHQTNVYARQKDPNTSFKTSRDEMLVFLGIVFYMSICIAPSIEDYWAAATRVAQVADVMNSKRFRTIRSHLHFSDNSEAETSSDRFYKIRPVLNAVTKRFLRVPATPVQAIDEVIVAYKGKRGSNLRQYSPTKQDRLGFKLFCRASDDGFVHDIVMYQGHTTFSSHHTPLSDEESNCDVRSKTAITLVKTVNDPRNTVIYSDHFFTSIGLVEYIQERYGCRYVGTAKENRIGNAPLMPVREMERDSVPRGTCEYASTNGILALRWKGRNIVTILSSDEGVEPKSTAVRREGAEKAEVEVSCPNVVKGYLKRMGAVDKSMMLTQLHSCPMRSKRWYLKFFGYVLDLCISNGWVLYKRDCLARRQKALSLKNFKLEISRSARMGSFSQAPRYVNAVNTDPIPKPKRGQRAVIPGLKERLDNSEPHMPIFINNRLTCKHCSQKDNTHRTKWACTKCKVALCLSDARNCFVEFHKDPRKGRQQSSKEKSLPKSAPQMIPGPSGDEVSGKDKGEGSSAEMLDLPDIKTEEFEEHDFDAQVKEELKNMDSCEMMFIDASKFMVIKTEEDPQD